jgi:hypothetical protein
MVVFSRQKTIEKALGLLLPFDNVCSRGCSLCEERESLVLLPEEEIYWDYDWSDISQFYTDRNGWLYLSREGRDCPGIILTDTSKSMVK